MSLQSPLHGVRVLVTSGGQGIGRATVEHLLAAGATVAVHYFSSAVRPEDFSAPERVHCFQADLRQRAAAAGMVTAAVEALGGLDALVNNAGSLIGRRRAAEVEPAFWQDSVDLNVSSMMWVTQAALPALTAEAGSSIVNLASLAGRKGGHAGSLVYSTMKGAVLTWTRALATELGPQGVRVNALAPGLILGTSFHAKHTTDASARETIAGIPLGRAGNPDDIARAVGFFVAERHGFITGATLDLNGGVYGC